MTCCSTQSLFIVFGASATVMVTVSPTLALVGATVIEVPWVGTISIFLVTAPAPMQITRRPAIEPTPKINFPITGFAPTTIARSCESLAGDPLSPPQPIGGRIFRRSGGGGSGG